MYRSVKRRQLEIALGVLWLADGLLQFQPYMFGQQFFAGILGMANMGLPGPLSRADYRIASVLVAHPAVWNTVFATLQVALGIGLLYRRTARLALLVSIPWALGVWVIGEGFGGLFMAGTSLLTGAPGAALLYGVIGVLLWPAIPPRLRESFGQSAWFVVWAGSALLELESVNHAAGVPAAQIANGRFGQPAWLAWLNDTAGHLIGRGGAAFALVLGAAAALVGVGVFWPSTRRAAITIGIVLSLAVGLLGQDLGGIATGHGTDPGTGPLLILLAVALWPARVSAFESTSDAVLNAPRRSYQSTPPWSPVPIGPSLAAPANNQ